MKMLAPLSASLLAAASVAVGSIPTEAAAQHARAGVWPPQRAASIRNQIDNLANDINRADQRNIISNREARGLRESLRSLRTQFRSYNRNGLTTREVQYLQTRANNIRMRLRMERFDWNNHRW